MNRNWIHKTKLIWLLFVFKSKSKQIDIYMFSITQAFDHITLSYVCISLQIYYQCSHCFRKSKNALWMWLLLLYKKITSYTDFTFFHCSTVSKDTVTITGLCDGQNVKSLHSLWQHTATSFSLTPSSVWFERLFLISPLLAFRFWPSLCVTLLWQLQESTHRVSNSLQSPRLVTSHRSLSFFWKTRLS